MSASASADAPGPARTQVRRLPEKAVHDVEARDRILDAARIGHLAVVDGGRPYVLAVACARDGEQMLFHGSRASRLFRSLAAGAPTCLTVTLLDGLVVARSAFESSMHYRSVMVLGSCTTLEGPAHLAGLQVITDHLMPGRWEHLREPTGQELAQTMVLALPLDQWSAKINTSSPTDGEQDLDAPVWAGVLPIVSVFGRPVDAPDLRAATPVPDYVLGWAP